MKGFISVVSVAALILAAGCGGNSGTTSACAAVGNHFASCGGSKAMAESTCNATACTDKQKAIDCIMTTQCNDTSAVNACASAQTCALTGATCATLVEYVNGCIDALGGPASDKISEADCNTATCTGSKQQAMNCIMGLACSSSLQSSVAGCRLQNGCN